MSSARSRVVAAVAVVAVAWTLALTSVVLSWVFALPQEPLPGMFLSPAPAAVQSHFDDIGVVVAVVYAPIAALLVVRRPHPVAAILAMHAIGSGLAAFGVQYGLLGTVVGGLPLEGLLAHTAGWGFVPGTFLTSVVPLLLLRPPPVLTRIVVPLAGVLAGVATLVSLTHDSPSAPGNPLAVRWPGGPDFAVTTYAIAAVGAIALSLTTAAVLVRRLLTAHRNAFPAVGWLTAGHLVLTGSYVATVLPSTAPVPEPLLVVSMIALIAAQVFYPAAVLVLGLDQRIWGVDVAVSRVLVTAILAVVAVGVYLGATTLLGGSAGRVDAATGLVAAAVVALALQPLRTVVARWVGVLVYGSAGDPDRALPRLGEQVGAFDSGADGLHELASALRTALRLEGVEIAPVGMAPQRAGRLEGEVVSISLGNDRAGVLQVSTGAGVRLGRARRQALVTLTGLVAAVVRLAQADQTARAARAALITARHEQRRILRRELHDGIGPALAGAGFALAAAANLRSTGADEQAEAMLRRIDDQLAEREHSLRALGPADDLDDLSPDGWAAALAELAGDFASAGPTVRVAIDPDLPAAPSATRRAVHLIAAEALLNAVRHAAADTIVLSLRRDGEHLVLRIDDDGVGVAAGAPEGVGLASMREWAASVGATLEVTVGRGTHVLVRLAPRSLTRPGPGR